MYNLRRAFKAYHTTTTQNLFHLGYNIQGLSTISKKLCCTHLETIPSFDADAIPYFDLNHYVPVFVQVNTCFALRVFVTGDTDII